MLGCEVDGTGGGADDGDDRCASVLRFLKRKRPVDKAARGREGGRPRALRECIVVCIAAAAMYRVERALTVSSDPCYMTSRQSNSLGIGDARLAEVAAVFPNVPALRLDGPLADSILVSV